MYNKYFSKSIHFLSVIFWILWKDAQKADFEESLKARIHRVFNNLADESKNEEEVSEEKLSADVSLFFKLLGGETCNELNDDDV